MSKDKSSEPAKVMEEPKAKAKETPKPVAVKPKKAEASIYIGPNLPNGLLNRTTLFKAGKIPVHTQKLIDQCPAIKSLIVPVSKLSQSEANLLDRSSVERAQADKVRKHFFKGAK